MKKIFSLILCMAILLGSLCITTPALQNEVLFTDTAAVTASNGATVSYDSYLNAVKVETNGSGATVSFDLADLADGETFYAAYLPFGYQVGELSVGLGNGTASISPSHKFVKLAGEKGTVTLPAAESAYTVYFYGAALDGDALVAKANGSIEKYTEDYLDLDEYEVERYTKYFWDNDIVFNESFFPVEEKDGSLEPITLMYDVDRVVSVKNSYLNYEYVYGEDYTIEDGKLVILPGKNITPHPYTDVYADRQINSSYREMIDGGYAFCGQQMMYFVGYLNITYTPANNWHGIVPESKGFLLTNVIDKLNTNGSTVKLMSIGDSLAGGANASISNGTLPYADIWCDMTAKGIQERYPDVTVQTTTIGEGGATASLAIQKMSNILTYAPDLIFIEFGTNECMQGDSAWMNGGYIDTLKSAIKSINDNLPNCDIVLVAPIISNPIFFPSDWFYAYADSLYSLEREGVAVADSTSLYQYMLSQKRYIDMSGDFLCHPSDFGTRLFVQTIMKTLEEGSEAEYIEGLSERILNYRYENEFNSEQWTTLTQLAATASADIASKTTVAAARDSYISYAAQLDEVPTIKDLEQNASIDCANLTFKTSKSMETVPDSGLTNTAAKFDKDTESLILTVFNVRKPAVMLDYSVGAKTLTADDYKYAVFTCMVPEGNSTRATATTIQFKVGTTLLTAQTVTHIRDGKYHSYIIDLTGIEGFTGTLTGAKINVFSSSMIDDALYISSLSYCADLESAKDTAIERERAANKDIASAVTYLMTADSYSVLSPEGQSIAGDVDGDGALRAKDVLIIRKYLSLGEPATLPACADVDGVDGITGADVVEMRKILAGVNAPKMTGGDAAIFYDTVNEAAKLTFTRDDGAISAHIEEAGITADMFKYVTVCAKTANQTALTVTVTVVTENGNATDTVAIEDGEFFTADTAKFADLTGKIETVTFTFGCSEGDTVYFDSFVLTPTYTTAQNAETVRIGAANLI